MCISIYRMCLFPINSFDSEATVLCSYLKYVPHFVLSEAHKPEGEDVFMEEDEALEASVGEKKTEDSGWTEMQDIDKDEIPSKEKEEDLALDETIHEVAVGKGLSGALNLLKDRGALKESVEWGGRNMDKKKSKLVGISGNDGKKEIRIERTDEYGRIVSTLI